ncbi:MAG: hypothetical protein LLF92_08915 [Planctomycetaceae bacterium]|nr:hypothetical protein [Planctomycetaceae bacterium]
MINKSNPVLNYISMHWRGELPLSVSFLVNGLWPNLALSVLNVLLNNGYIDNPVVGMHIFIFCFVFCIFVLYPWQIIGIWRSAEKRIEKSGKYFWSRCIQIIILLRIVCFLVAIHSKMPAYKDNFLCILHLNEKASLTLEKDNTIIHLQGRLGFGNSKDVSNILKTNPGIDGIILDSIGGRSYEGRELARIISDYNLNTYSFEQCLSAATTAFIGGRHRYLGPGAVMGFHKCGLEYGRKDIFGYLEKENVKDMLIFKKHGINEEFTKKSHASDVLWYPTTKELLNAGVIHGIVNEDLKEININSGIIDENEVFQRPCNYLPK